MADDNPRQELTIVLGEKTYVVRASFKTIVAVERVTGIAAGQFGMRVGKFEATVVEMAFAISALIGATEKKGPTADEVGEALFPDGGFAALREPLADFLIGAVRGNKDHVKEAAGTSQAHPQQRG